MNTSRWSIRLAAIALALLAACSSAVSSSPAETTLAPTTTAAPTSTSCDPSLDGFTNHVAYAKVPGAIDVFAAPGDTVPMQVFANPRQTDTDPPVDVPLVFLATEEPIDNCDWLRVLLPVRPNGTEGWVRRSDVRMEGNDYRIEVSLSGFNLRAYDDDELIVDATVGVASNNTPTPGGVYYTTELLQPPDPDGVYGTFAFGLSGFSEVLTSFNGGQGQLGIHGTNDPGSLGTQVSSGCVRLHNDQIDQLVARIDNPYGIRVEISA